MDQDNQRIIIALKAQNTLIQQLNDKIKELTIANHYLIDFLKSSDKCSDEKNTQKVHETINQDLEDLNQLIKQSKPLLLNKNVSYHESEKNDETVEIFRDVQENYGINNVSVELNANKAKKIENLYENSTAVKDVLECNDSKPSSVAAEELSVLSRSLSMENSVNQCGVNSYAPKPSPNEQVQVNHLVWCKFSALIKGYLTRRVLLSTKVQYLLRTVRDCAAFALSFRGENDKLSESNYSEIVLSKRTLHHMKSAIEEIHEIFFKWSVSRRLQLVEQTRIAEKTEFLKRKREMLLDISETSALTNLTSSLPHLIGRHNKTMGLSESAFFTIVNANGFSFEFQIYVAMQDAHCQ